MSEIQKIKYEIRIDGFESVYYFRHGKEFYHTPERHSSWEMLYVDRGAIIAITDGIGCELSEGMVIFHEPGDLHAHISNREVSNNMFVVTFTTSSPAMDFFKKKIFTLDKTSRMLLSLFMQEARGALGEIQGDYKNRHALSFDSEAEFGSVQLMASHLEELFIKLIRSGGDRIHSSDESRRIAKNSTVESIEDYLRTNVYKSLDMSEICGRFHIGKSQLSLIFKECTGKSLMHYYAELKIEEAKRLLADNNLSVSEISDSLGYSGIHSFSRSFKKATGFSPTSYKESILL